MRVSRLAGWWLALALVCGGAAHAQALSFVEPAASTVRGQVPIRVDLGAGYEKGYVVFYLGEPGKPLRFRMATVADRQGLFGFDWDTQAPDAKVPDGEYRVLAIGYSATGEVVGQKALTLVVQNEVTTSSLPTRGVLLRYNLTPGRENKFLATTVVKTEAVEGEKGDYGMFNGGVMAFWNSRVLSRNPDGKAQVRNTVYTFAERSARNKIKPMEANGKSVSLMMAADGDLVRRTDQDVLFPFGELGLEFPEQPVKIGDSWRSRLRFMVDGRTAREDTVLANHTLSSVVWKAGYRTAVIDSTFEAGPYNVELKGEDKENAEWLAGVTIIIKGHRRTYFAYQPEVGRVLQIEEDQQQFCTLDFEEPPPAAAMGAGMPGMEGGMPGMAPGGMPPGMPGAVPGAMPGAGMPGAPGAGMGQPAPVVEKPAGFDKGSTAFRRATPPAAAATAGMAAPGMVAGPPPEPPKVDVAHFKRNVTMTLSQDFLATG